MEPDPKLDEIVDCLYRVAVKALIIKDKKILLVKDDRDTGWSFPGGGVDFGEDLVEALRRELSEEIGVNPSSIHVETEVKSVLIGQIKDGIPRCNVHFMVDLNDEKVTPTNEVNELKWIDLSKVDITEFESPAGKREDLQAIFEQLKGV